MSLQVLTNTGTAGTQSSQSITPQDSSDFLLFLTSDIGVALSAPWSGTNGYYTQVTSGPTPVSASAPASWVWANLIASFTANGAPTHVQNWSLGSGGIGSGAVLTSTSGSSTTAGNAIIVTVQATLNPFALPPTVSDSNGNAYQAFSVTKFDPVSGASAGCYLYVALNTASGPLTVSLTSNTLMSNAIATINEWAGIYGVASVTTQAASGLTRNSATANGDITSLGGDAQCTLIGFVYDTTTHSLPGNVAPGSSGYAFNITTVGAFPTGTFTEPLTGLIPGTQYFVRAVAQNSSGYSYGNEVTFTSVGLPAPTISVQITPQSITLSQSATLSWASVNATSMTIDNGIGSVVVTGSMVVTPTASMWYHFTASGPGGTAHAAVEMKVYQAVSPSYIMARDLNNWQDMNGPYSAVDVTIGSITLSQPGESLIPVQHIIGYYDLADGERPSVSFLPNEIVASDTQNFIPVPEDQVVPEPPTGANPSTSLQQLRFPLNMVNSLTSQFMHHLQVKHSFPQTNAPHTLKAMAIKSDQD
jgi:hypothetical protein